MQIVDRIQPLARCLPSIARSLATVFAVVAVASTTGWAAEPGPIGAESAALRQQHWLIPSPTPQVLMDAQLFRPPGVGPFPLAVINHGSEQDERARKRMKAPVYPGLISWLVARGYAVLLPVRPGHGATGGRYLENQGWCGSADFLTAGDGAARSIASAVQYMQKLDFITANTVVVIGNSAGGWGTIALAAQNPRGVVAAVNFSGGRGGRNGNRPDNNCSPDRLVAAAGEYGKRARIPTLWLYSENDTYFPPQLSRKLAAAFSAAGGSASYQLLPAIAGDGHALIDSRETWVGALDAFLDAVEK